MKKIKFYSGIFFLCFFLQAVAQESGFNSGSALTESQVKEVLDFHNQARMEVGTAPLVWSVEISDFAQQWADHLALTMNCQFEHRPKTGQWKQKYDENIYMGWGQDKSHALLAVQLWYEEKKEYTHEVVTNSNWYVAGHYRQMIWQKTKELGMGMANCKNGNVIVVANYNVGGNMIGESAY